MATTNRRRALGCAIFLAVALVGQAAVGAANPSAALATANRTTWINPYDNVKVEVGDCGVQLCGWVVWATSEAEKDAREGGTARLVGTELLRGYHRTGPASWAGRVFVPDMGRTFSSTIQLTSPDRLTVSGCLLGRFLCKSQVWRRV